VKPPTKEGLKAKDPKGYDLVSSGKYTKMKFLSPTGKAPNGIY